MLVRHRWTPIVAAAALAAAVTGAGAAQETSSPSVRSYQAVVPDALEWQNHPEFPELDRAVLYGSLVFAEPYVYRLRAYAPARLPLHGHARTEYITVLKGRLHHAPEDRTRASAETCGPGCFVVVPGGQRHQAWLEAGTVVQVHGVGPTEARGPDRSSPPG